MSKKIFISYSHHQSEWVRDRLLPCLKAGSADVLIDVERFQAARAVYMQMDAAQEEVAQHADGVQVIVLSPQYLESAPCQHEMNRAIATDVTFTAGRVIPVIRVECPIPKQILSADPIYVKLTAADDHKPEPWKLLLDACGVDLGTDTVAWLRALDRVRTHLGRRESVNLRIVGESVQWRGLLRLLNLPEVDLNSGMTASRHRLVSEMLRVNGHHGVVSPEPDDLADLQTRLENSSGATLILRHFDRAKQRNYGEDFYWCLNNLVETRKLTLLVQSREELVSLVPPSLNQSSFVSQTKVVELRSR